MVFILTLLLFRPIKTRYFKANTSNRKPTCAIELNPDRGPLPTIDDDIRLNLEMSSTNGATRLELGSTEDGIPFNSNEIIPFS